MASKLVTSGKWGRRGSFMRHLPAAMRADVAEGLQRVARTIQQDAAARAPVDTGRLRRTLLSRAAIASRDRGLEVEFGLRTRTLQKRAFYAPFVEYGTKGYSQGAFRLRGVSRAGLGRYRKVKVNVPARPARPFFRPAVQANIQLWRREMRAALERALRRANRG